MVASQFLWYTWPRRIQIMPGPYDWNRRFLQHLRNWAAVYSIPMQTDLSWPDEVAYLLKQISLQSAV